MKVFRLYTTILARFLMSLVFLVGAVNKILHWHETERMLLSVLSEWQSNVGAWEGLQDFLFLLISWVPLLLLAAIVCELLGGLSILLGFKEKIGAAFLIIFLIPATLLIHAFWFTEGTTRELQITHFLKNLAILGGLFMVLLQGTEDQKNSFPIKFG